MLENWDQNYTRPILKKKQRIVDKICFAVVVCMCLLTVQLLWLRVSPTFCNLTDEDDEENVLPPSTLPQSEFPPPTPSPSTLLLPSSTSSPSTSSPSTPSPSTLLPPSSTSSSSTLLPPTTTSSPSKLSQSTSPLSALQQSMPSSPLETPSKPPSERTIYVITPTYPRAEQVAELTRLGQTLKLVPNLVWLVIEDAVNTTTAVERLLIRLRIPFVHLTAPIPKAFLSRPIKSRPRGVSNRNRALEWLRANATSGVFYFADDDNSYDIRLFEEMRDTRRVSMWPVGLLSLGLASPVVRAGEVVGFYEGWVGNRKFAVDMAEFAVSVEFLLQRPKAIMPFTVGMEEEGFLKSLAPLELKDIEPKASNCTEVLVWHTQTRSPSPLMPLNLTAYSDTNLAQLYDNLYDELRPFEN